MADTGVVLLAAFGGGLAGSVLQPVVEATFEALRGRGQRRKRREQRLRAMVENYIQSRVAVMLAVAQVCHIYEAANVDLAQIEEVRARLRSELPPTSHGMWQPYRVKDDTLRKLLRDYVKAGMAFFPLLYARDEDPPISMEKLAELERNHNDLQVKIEECMDALDWPEVD